MERPPRPLQRVARVAGRERAAQGGDELHRRLMAAPRMPKSRLTHVDAANRPTMVDVGAKRATRREASAEAIVKLPPAVARELKRAGHRTKKGPVFDTAIVAGVMAAKKTHEI